MTFFSASAVTSGRPYKITKVNGEEPRELSQFVGERSFTVDTESGDSLISGVGSSHDAEVRFHEKDVDHDGKDVRVWHIHTDLTGDITATTGS